MAPNFASSLISMGRKRSAPESSTRMVKGIHRFTLENYSICKRLNQGSPIRSSSFEIGGHEWAVLVFVNGTRKDSTKGRGRYVSGHIHVGLHITLLRSQSDNGVGCLLRMKLLDQSGKNHHLILSTFDGFPYMGPTMITPGHYVGFPCFIDQLNLEKSSYLKDDCLKIECMVGVVLSSSDTELMDRVPRCDNVGISLLSIMSSGEGADVVFKVRGTKFSAHKPILAQRSSYFQSMFAMEFVPHGQEIVIDSMEPRVFKALLHFIYSDTLPEDDKRLLETGYALGPSVFGTFAAKLFVASAQYGLGNLKSISEHYVWISMSVGRFPETLHLADINDASSLKHLCFKYAMDNFQALVEHNSFDYLREHCPSLLNEVYDYISEEKVSVAATAGRSGLL